MSVVVMMGSDIDDYGYGQIGMRYHDFTRAGPGSETASPDGRDSLVLTAFCWSPSRPRHISSLA